MPTATPQIQLVLDEKDLSRIPAHLERKAGLAVRKVTMLVEADAVRYAPYAKYHGGGKGTNLKNSITSYSRGAGFNTVGTAGATASYAIYVHTGTGIYGPKGQPFTIVPVNKKALFWPGAEHPVKKVTIRGAKANPFLKKAFDKNAPKLGDFIFDGEPVT